MHDFRKINAQIWIYRNVRWSKHFFVEFMDFLRGQINSYHVCCMNVRIAWMKYSSLEYSIKSEFQSAFDKRLFRERRLFTSIFTVRWMDQMEPSQKKNEIILYKIKRSLLCKCEFFSPSLRSFPPRKIRYTVEWRLQSWQLKELVTWNDNTLTRLNRIEFESSQFQL